MFTIRKLALRARRLWAPALIYGAVLLSGYLLQTLQGPAQAPSTTQTTR